MVMMDDPGSSSIPGANPEGPLPEDSATEEQSAEPGGLNHSQKEVLERCLHALAHAKNDSHTLAALLLVKLPNYSQISKSNVLSYHC